MKLYSDSSRIRTISFRTPITGDSQVLISEASGRDGVRRPIHSPSPMGSGLRAKLIENED